MKTCPVCNQTYPDDIDLCPRDGSRLAAEAREERECPYCAEKILRKARVCKHCGREVELLTAGGAPNQIPIPAPPERTPEMQGSQVQVSKPAPAAVRPASATVRMNIGVLPRSSARRSRSRSWMRLRAGRITLLRCLVSS
jgi:DNA-directed RNA polymerase subunit RPC12/RpoP